MSVRFARSGTNIIKDHNDLINKGKRTHKELDYIANEVEEARGGFASLDDRLLDIINRIGTGGGGSCTDVDTYLYYSYVCEEDGITNIRLDEGSFRKGFSELEVFRGGLKQSISDDYVEVSNKEIAFCESLWVGEIVVLRVRDRAGKKANLGFHSEYVITTEPTTDFTLNYLFDTEGRSLEIYLNGLLQGIGEDYVILSTNTIRFRISPPVGSLVYFRVADKFLNEEPVLLQEKFIAEEDKLYYKFNKINYNVDMEELEVYVMGVRYTKGIDYEETSPFSITFLKPIEKGSIILVCKENTGYAKSAHLHCYGIIPIGIIDGTNKEFLLPHIPQKGSVLAYVGGVRQDFSSYEVTSNKLMFNFSIPKDTDLFVDYII